MTVSSDDGKVRKRIMCKICVNSYILRICFQIKVLNKVLSNANTEHMYTTSYHAVMSRFGDVIERRSRTNQHSNPGGEEGAWRVGSQNQTTELSRAPHPVILIEYNGVPIVLKAFVPHRNKHPCASAPQNLVMVCAFGVVLCLCCCLVPCASSLVYVHYIYMGLGLGIY